MSATEMQLQAAPVQVPARPASLRERIATGYCRRAWNAFCDRLVADDATRAMFSVFESHYGAPGRRYHGFTHLAHCLEEFEAVRDFAMRPDEVELAIFCHDVICDARPRTDHERITDEQYSSLCAIDLAKRLRFSDRAGMRAAELVLVTAHETPPESRDEELVVDIDLAIFGQGRSDFDRYERGIRAEYSWVPEAIYYVERAKVLKSFLGRERIYHTDVFAGRYQEAAVDNLTRAVKQLEDSKRFLELREQEIRVGC